MNQNFTQVPNEVLNNSNLSALAKIIYSQFLSNKKEYKPHLNEFRKNRNKEGKEAHTSAMKELEELNLVSKKRVQGSNGKFSYEYIISPWTNKPTTVKPSTVEPYTVTPTTNNTNLNNINSNNINQKNINEKTASSSIDIIKEEIVEQDSNKAAEAAFELNDNVFKEEKQIEKKVDHSTQELILSDMETIMDEMELFNEDARNKVIRIYEQKKGTIQKSSTGFFKRLIADELKEQKSRNEREVDNSKVSEQFNKVIAWFYFTDYATKEIRSYTFKDWLKDLSTRIGKKKCLEIILVKSNLEAMLEKSPYVLKQHTNQVAIQLESGLSFIDAVKDLERIDTTSIGKKYI
jgi:hypothetical protein